MKTAEGSPAKIGCGVIVIDDGLYAYRWLTTVMLDPAIQVRFVSCIRPSRAHNFNPGGARGFFRTSLSRLAYYGVLASIKFGCKAGLSAAKDMAFRLGLSRRAHSVRAAARALGIEIVNPPNGDVNDPSFCRAIEHRRPDLLICAFSQGAEEHFLLTPRLGCLNVHFSMLPAQRGREPTFYSMLAGKGGGVSVHWMVAEFDAGDVVCQEAVEVERYPSLDSAILACCSAAVRVVPKAVRKAAERRGERGQATAVARANGWPTSEDVAMFRKKGYRFI